MDKGQPHIHSSVYCRWECLRNMQCSGWLATEGETFYWLSTCGRLNVQVKVLHDFGVSALCKMCLHEEELNASVVPLWGNNRKYDLTSLCQTPSFVWQQMNYFFIPSILWNFIPGKRHLVGMLCGNYAYHIHIEFYECRCLAAMILEHISIDGLKCQTMLGSSTKKSLIQRPMWKLSWKVRCMHEGFCASECQFRISILFAWKL